LSFMCCCSLAVSAQSREDTLRFASSVGTLNLAMRHEGPTGPRRGPAVLILHGGTFPSGNAAGWKIEGRSWMDELTAAGYDVYALDFLGFGQSDRYPQMASETSAGAPLGDVESMVVQVDRAVTEILKRQGDERVNIIAHSAGTFVAGRYAQLHPSRVARLVLFGAPAPSGAAQPGATEAPNTPEQYYLQVSRADQWEAFDRKVRDTEQLDRGMFENWATAYLATDPASSRRQPPSVRVPAGMTVAYELMLRQGRLPYDPAQITSPVLLIRGEWDEVAPLPGNERLFEQLGSPLKRLVIISHAGHRAHLEKNRMQLYRETECFLQGGDEADSAVYAVFFEVKPNGTAGREAYLATAHELRSRLDAMRGFVSVERFENQSRPGWLLSLSLWRDESALIAWREVFEHRAAQDKGRHGVFEDYRVRVARQVSEGGDFSLAEAADAADVPGIQRLAGISVPEHHLALIESGNAPKATHWKVIRDYGLNDRSEAPRP
jgi:pimeloyl-ACP methyl ester carboxylesterase/heme-degrading monooxygenase HmoA